MAIVDLGSDPVFKKQYDTQNWEQGKETLAKLFSTRCRNEWCELLEGTDICFAPVLNFDESVDHPHNKEREVFVELDGFLCDPFGLAEHVVSFDVFVAFARERHQKTARLKIIVATRGCAEPPADCLQIVIDAGALGGGKVLDVSLRPKPGVGPNDTLGSVEVFADL